MRLALLVAVLILAGCNSARVDDRDGDGLGVPDFQAFASERRAEEPGITDEEIERAYIAGHQAELKARDAAHAAATERQRVEHAAQLERERLEAAASARRAQGRTLAWIARIATLATLGGIGLAVAFPWVPNRVVAACGAVGVAAFAAQYGLASLARFETWLPAIALGGLVITFGLFVVPWVWGLRNVGLDKEGRQLAKDHPREGLAVRAAAKPSIYKSRKVLAKASEAVPEIVEHAA